jgi:hypothetical protein
VAGRRQDIALITCPSDLFLVHCGYDEDLLRSEYAAEIGTAREGAEQCRQAVLAKGGFTELAEG